MALIKRSVKGTNLTPTEVDANFQFVLDSITGVVGGITYTDITWAALVALAVGSRETYYNITTGDPNNSDIIYGEVMLNPDKETFYYNITNLILIE